MYRSDKLGTDRSLFGRGVTEFQKRYKVGRRAEADPGAGCKDGRIRIDGPAVYLAGPDGFTESGHTWHQRVVIPAVAAAGFLPLSPWDFFGEEFEEVAAMEPGLERLAAYRRLDERVGATNVELIDRSAAVLALLDGTDVDSGTAAEIGYASTRIPVVGLRTDVRPAGDNEGVTVNLQVEHFIRRSGGGIHRRIEDAVDALLRLVPTS